MGVYMPFLSSIVTVSFAHFIRNLPCANGQSVSLLKGLGESSACVLMQLVNGQAYLTSFIAPRDWTFRPRVLAGFPYVVTFRC
jgi:hypothetical protein